jgi:hypothetical protein
MPELAGMEGDRRYSRNPKRQFGPGNKHERMRGAQQRKAGVSFGGGFEYER